MARGGKREGAGRPQGSRNKTVPEVKAAAREYTQAALETLAQIMLTSQSDAAKVSASTALLDRGWGKPSTVVTGDEDGGAVQVVTRIELVGVRPGES
jgi:phage gp46-like protein